MSVPPVPEKWKELLLAHHPDLPCFRDDVIIICNQRICAGCLLGYPTAIFVILFIHPFCYESVFISLFLALVSQIRRVSGDRQLDNFFRYVAGIALGFGICGLWYSAGTGNWILVIIIISGGLLYALSKYFSMRARLVHYLENNPEQVF